MSAPTPAAAAEVGNGTGGGSSSPARQRMVNIDLDSPLRSRGGGGSSSNRGLRGSREVLLQGSNNKRAKGAAAGSPGSEASADSASRVRA